MKKFFDLLWVLQAFLRGKILRQKVYQLRGGLIRLPVATTAKRMTMLMRWWGLRPATLEELTALIQQKSLVPYLIWDGDGWGKDDVDPNDPTAWNKYRFLTVRK